MTGAALNVLGRPLLGASAVAVGIADFLVRTELERLRLFRLHLQATVDRISPLLVDLAAMEQIDLDRAFQLMLPPQDWPWRPLQPEIPPRVHHYQLRKGWAVAGTPPRNSARFRRSFANPGLVIRDVEHPRGRFAIRPCGRVMGFTAGIGQCLLSAFGNSAMLKLSERLPETLVTAMPGRPLDQLVDHPAFAGRGYRVVRVEPDLGDHMPVLIFRAPLVPLHMSWSPTQLAHG